MQYILTVQGHSRTYMRWADTIAEVGRLCDMILKNNPKSIIFISEYKRTIVKHSDVLKEIKNE